MYSPEELKGIRETVDDRLDEYQSICRQSKREAQALDTNAVNFEAATKAKDVLVAIAEKVQLVMHQRISSVVTNCLQTVFPEDPYEFKILLEKKRNKTQAALVFERNGLVIDPMNSSGGGVIDVAAFALRLACILLHKPAVERLLVLDEPFKFVSEEFQPNVRQMMEELSEKLEFQFIMVTHIQALVTGKQINYQHQPKEA